MRTNIVLDEELVQQAKALTGIRTTRALVHEALRVLIRLGEQGQVRELRGQLRWEGDPGYTLRGLPVSYTDPFGSVSEEDWDALR